MPRGKKTEQHPEMADQSSRENERVQYEYMSLEQSRSLMAAYPNTTVAAVPASGTQQNVAPSKPGDMFEDPSFSCDNQHNGLNKDVVWKRPKEIVDAGSLPIMYDPACLDPQGKAPITHRGDVWFLSACKELARNEKLFEKVILDKNKPLSGPNYTGGPYNFSLYFNGEWTEVSVDDRLPWYGGNLYYSRSANPNEFWISLLEKAYAKLHGGYGNINDGLPNMAFTEVTGGLSEHMLSTTPDKVRLWKRLIGATKARNSFIVLGTPESHLCEDGEGWKSGWKLNVRAGQGYELLAAYEFYTVQGNTVQLLKLRNSWNNIEFLGDWGLKSPKWSEVDDGTKREIGLYQNLDGIFFVAFDDLEKLFKYVSIHTMCPDFRQDGLGESCRHMDTRFEDQHTVVFFQPKNSGNHWTLVSVFECADWGKDISYKTPDLRIYEIKDFLGDTLDKVSEGKVNKVELAINENAKWDSTSKLGRCEQIKRFVAQSGSTYIFKQNKSSNGKNGKFVLRIYYDGEFKCCRL